MEKQTEPADGQGEKLEQALLDECKPLLRNILTHWEPKPEPVDKPDSSNLNVATACLILKWALKTLTESPYDDSSTSALLKWVNGVILPRSAIVDAVLSDEITRKDFLRLYHHTAQEHGSTVDTLQLFSRVMVHLLEARGGFPDVIHQTVLRTCLPANTDDGAKKGKAAAIEHSSQSQSFPL